MSRIRPLLLPVIAASLPLCCAAQSQNTAISADKTAVDAVSTSAPQQPVINFQVLKSRRVNAGDHAITYNRVAPPVLPERPAVPAVPIPSPLSAEAMQAMKRRESKKFELLFLSATVLDRQVTELRWFGDGGEYRAFSNIDFNYLSGPGEIETDDTVYELIMGIGNETREQVDAANSYITEHGLPSSLKKQIPPLSQFSPVRSEYMLVDDGSKPVPDNALAGMDALHSYYDANRQQLIDDYNKREASRIVQEQWQKEHPPVPKDTVINYWIEGGKGGTRILDKGGSQ